jgi:hypothetical protein
MLTYADELRGREGEGTQFTCFTRTTVHILTPEEGAGRTRAALEGDGTQFTCFTDVCCNVC